MLGELAPEVEATEAHAAKEEDERSSSTLGKDDNEGNIASDEDQIADAAGQQVKAQQEELTPIEVDECVPETTSKLFLRWCQYDIILPHS